MEQHWFDLESKRRRWHYRRVGAMGSLRMLRKHAVKDGPLHDGMLELERRALLLRVAELQEEIRRDGSSLEMDKRAHAMCDAYLKIHATARKR